MKASMFHFRTAAATALVLLAGSVVFVCAKPAPDAATDRRLQKARKTPDSTTAPTAIKAGGGFGPIQGVLTAEQRSSLRDALSGQRASMRGLREQLQAAHEAMFEASVSARLDENAVRQKAMEAGRLEAELAVLRARVLSQVKPPLSTEQIQKLKSLTPTPGQANGQQSLNPRRAKRALKGARDENDLPAAPNTAQ